MSIQAPRGTKDWFGPDMAIRTEIEAIARELSRRYHIKEVISPVFEHTELFQRSVGETTDVVQKEMYTFMDKGNRSITLKPEGTAGVARLFLENSLYANPQPTKLFYVTPAFRYEKPQAGRLRQHHQFGVEIFGTKEPLAEIEIISLLKDLFKQLGIQNAQLHINSIGCPTCRSTYNEALKAYLNQYKESLCDTCKGRLDKNPMRIIDCKSPNCQSIVKDAPRAMAYLDEACQTHFDQLKALLDALGITYQIDVNIVRGLDYYTRTVFEFIDAEGMTICGGGRYDNLINEITSFDSEGKSTKGKDIPAVGFGIGIERIMVALEREHIVLALEKVPDIFIGIMGQSAVTKVYQLVHDLRNSGVIAETDFLARGVKAQMKYADKLGARYTAIIGDNEIAENSVRVKNMVTGEASVIELSDFVKSFMKL